jgi:hypothetical protein
VIDDSKGGITLAATSHREQYVYLDHDIISDYKESILRVFTGQMHTVDITTAYQYAPFIDDVKYLVGIKSLEKLKEEEYNKEIIASKMNRLSKYKQPKEIMMTNPMEVLSVWSSVTKP